MASRHLSLRIDEDSFKSLEEGARRGRETVSNLARRLLDEGLRMDAHPDIVFREGPSGRRAAVADGPDVWVVARVFRGMDGGIDEVVARTATLTELSHRQVRAAIAYYVDYRDEIDSWLEDLDREAERAHAAWLRERDAIRR